MKFFVLIFLLFITCNEDPVSYIQVYGCTDSSACNFNSEANTFVPNSCIYDTDCADVCGGSAVADECGVCNGSGIAAGACDCDGNILDECGVCDGDGTSCSCDNIDCTYLDSGCIFGVCDNGQCIEGYLQSGSVCDDGNACTTQDICNGQGTCISGSPVICDDGNSCSQDSCSSSSGCVYDYSSNNQAACDDGDACTSDDVCNEGSCSGINVPNCP